MHIIPSAGATAPTVANAMPTPETGVPKASKESQNKDIAHVKSQLPVVEIRSSKAHTQLNFYSPEKKSFLYQNNDSADAIALSRQLNI
mmetsp:Transcript_29433/g.44564  ORF Transcript_29433/g.44564 Transcript_29433/m.44564 type:complete len:88 (-) Transcript_29433:1015-1278(-)